MKALRAFQKVRLDECMVEPLGFYFAFVVIDQLGKSRTRQRGIEPDKSCATVRLDSLPDVQFVIRFHGSTGMSFMLAAHQPAHASLATDPTAFFDNDHVLPAIRATTWIPFNLVPKECEKNPREKFEGVL